MEQGSFSFGGQLAVFGEQLAAPCQSGTWHREGSAGCGLRIPGFESSLCCSSLDRLPYLSEFCLFPLLCPSYCSMASVKVARNENQLELALRKGRFSLWSKSSHRTQMQDVYRNLGRKGPELELEAFDGNRRKEREILGVSHRLASPVGTNSKSSPDCTHFLPLHLLA